MAELSASCPICSPHMAFIFRRDRLLSPLLSYFSCLCSVCPCFCSSPLSFISFLSIILSKYFYAFIPSAFSSRNLLSAHLHRHKFILLMHVPALPALPVGYHGNPSQAPCQESECALLLHHSLPWILAHLALFYSLCLLLPSTLKHKHTYTHTKHALQFT